MSSDAQLSLLLNSYYPFSAVLSGSNISIISKAYQFFGETLKALGYDASIFNDDLAGNETLQMKFEDDGIVSSGFIPCSSSDLLLGEAAVLLAPTLQMMIRKRYKTTPKGYPPESQLHLSNRYLDNIVDNALVLTNGRTWEKILAGNIMIMNDNAYVTLLKVRSHPGQNSRGSTRTNTILH